MLKKLPFPLLYILEAVLAVPMFLGFVATVSFLASKPLSDLDLHGKSLPAGWEAAVFNHGRYLPGYLISNHPAMFGLALILFIASGALVARVSWIRMMQSKAAPATMAGAHKLANAGVFAVWAILGYVLFMHMTGVSPT